MHTAGNGIIAGGNSILYHSFFAASIPRVFLPFSMVAYGIISKTAR
jgi:hypothetical protein